MSGTEAPPLTVVQPGQGRAGDLGSIGVVFKLWGHDTGGALSIVEHPFPVGALVPPHLHTREDEYSIVTEGEIGFRSGDREVVLEPGGYITKPRGELHTMWNAGKTPARMIESSARLDSRTSSVTSPTSPQPAHPLLMRSPRSPTPTACASATPSGCPT